ncbi:M20/M25/M40 family metallo-hydrolase [Solitalea canadensis]|uniref:Putative aminopeptidase n=1 Tax=Solitalea canadensis (strain ATCC 29591 / DSM 3403 / JCM 21819 / LMG 8368 / NBRC 15130 / NCIMB 12057 / USAM 9D) TaxID=929556 RepID=H8KPU9_SOLCM|nr:M20/M25/M40 family metallo-hydrolase [Solitalea canadensis]AFD05997.1 putative aminopeptidase [Solitalea canadensis DSM 3403]
MRVSFFLLLFFLPFKQLLAQSEITEAEIKQHIEFLSSDENRGRFPGTKETKKVVDYLIENFRKAGISKLNGSFRQPFVAKLRVMPGVKDTPYVKTWNVVGVIEGSDPVLKKEYIVLGAHYDHLGMGGPSSKKKDTVAIHHGADDNASGTAALLEIGEKLSANRSLLKRSIILISFGAEEQGLLGSKYFTEHPTVPLNSIKLMINMDMVGRLNESGHIYMGGAGTFDGGVELMKGLGKEFNLNPIVHAGDVGGSDHISFYKKQISVLGLHTGGHPQYHTPEDIASLINIKGEKQVCEYIYQAIVHMAQQTTPINFIYQN